MLTLRVSQLDTYRAWTEEEDSDVGWLLNELTARQETPAMARGTAFHKCLEMAFRGTVARLQANGYTFEFSADIKLTLPSIREIRLAKDYGGITVTGKVDAIEGRHIIDHKSTSSLDAERYMHGFQWRYYLDLAGADRFTWHIFEMDEVDARVYNVYAMHTLEQWKYPGMHEDCKRLALDCKEFCDQYLPGYDVTKTLEEAEA